jgi:cell division septation protein DedD
LYCVVQFSAHVTAHTHDDGFREIQLSGKQLIFLFMVITISGVVIFLAGVFVGRDVRGERAALAQAQTVEAPPTPDVVPQPPTVTSSVAAQVDPKTPPPAPIDDLSYPQRLDAGKPPVDKLVPPAKPPAPAKDVKAPDAVSAAAKTVTPPPPVSKPAPVAAAPAAASAPAPAADRVAAGTGAPGNGFVVQVAAVNVRGEADAIVKRLTSKGYAAFVQTPAGAANVFRVRVGTFKTRREADAVASKLQKEEQYKPWVTR